MVRGSSRRPSMERSNQQEHCRAVIGTRPYKKFGTIHNNDQVPEGTGMRHPLEGLGRPSFFVLSAP